MEPVSAFSVHAGQRGNAEQLPSRKKKKDNSQKAYSRRRKQKDVKQSANQQRRRKERTKAARKSNDTSNAVKLDKPNSTSSAVLRKLKLKLKAKKERKMKEWKKKKKSGKGEAIQMTEVQSVNVKTKNSESDSNNMDTNDSVNANELNVDYVSAHDPVENSRQLLGWLLHPIDIKIFFKDNWEKTPVYVKRDQPNYYRHIVSTPLLDEVLRKNHILFTKHIDITSYSGGVRETHNPPGRALPSVVWDYYQNQCSVRMLNPQTFIPAIHALNSTLQESFGCFVGANLYLTPPNSQGFAPHYDDVEAFILQIEGQKRWRLYKPLSANEYLPRYSSKNFDQSEIGEPILDTVVKAGDLLYLPRGTIHQGTTLDDTHSLHVTLSVYQRNSWFDLLEKVLPQALKRAADNDRRFRQGLPLDYLTYVGAAYDASDRKDAFKSDINNLIALLLEHVDVDNAADLMAKNHIHDFLPPFVFKNERKCTVAEDGEIMTTNGLVKNRAEIMPETRMRLLRLHCIR
ncbi:PREDICTED: bifunctional lysine-specific demethylase and histidyl-hydroxylase NO66 isoform X2 [Vollenhovia emeryi]|nr:PREDICTED: bifunctional lysine-specific demethylase and histidyl-hydroxylase NO66 isoform X2 [Vollenhovia emeryi]